MNTSPFIVHGTVGDIADALRLLLGQRADEVDTPATSTAQALTDANRTIDRFRDVPQKAGTAKIGA